MSRVMLLVAIFALTPTASAQWVNISESNRTYTDFAINGNVLVATNDGQNGEAVLMSPDLGGSWSAVTPGVNRSARNVLATPSGFVLQIDGNFDWLGDASGTVWTAASGIGSNTTEYFRDPTNGRIYVTTQSSNLRISDDDGATWSNANVVSRDGELTWVHARGNTILTSYNQYLAATFLSLDGGATFVDTFLGPASAGFVAEDGRLYVLTSPFSVGNVPGVLMRSSDAGQTWEEVATPPSLGGVFGQQSTPLRQKSLLFVSGNTIVYGPNDRVYVSHDDGETFQDMSEGLIAAGARQSAMRTMQVVGSDMYLLVVDFRDEAPTNSGYGIYRRPLSELGITLTSTAIESPEVPSLVTRMWPNPSRGFGSVQLSSPGAGPVTMTLVDVLGRQVHRQLLGSADAGYSTLGWSAPALAPGIYVAQIEVAGRVESRLMSVVR